MKLSVPRKLITGMIFQMLSFVGTVTGSNRSCVPSVNIREHSRQFEKAQARISLGPSCGSRPFPFTEANASYTTRQTSPGECMCSKYAATKSGPTSFGFLWGTLPTAPLRWYSEIFVSSPPDSSGTSSDIYIGKATAANI